MFDKDYAQKCVVLDITNLQGEFVKYTADLAYWGQQVAEAKHQEALAKQQRDIQAADLDTLAREALMGDKKPTEAMVNGWVTRHPVMAQAEADLIVATFELDKMKAVYDALRSKRDMLVGLGAQQRAEMQHDPAVKVEF